MNAVNPAGGAYEGIVSRRLYEVGDRGDAKPQLLIEVANEEVAELIDALREGINELVYDKLVGFTEQELPQ